MKKKVLMMTLAMATVLSNACFASIIPPKGAGQIGYNSTVLCNSLSLRQAPDYNSAVVQTLGYGDNLIVMETQNGWAHCALGDAEESVKGWVNEDYIVVDPSWYKTVESTPVYAWNDTGAPKVALIDAGTTLPILRDDGNWIVVGLRGAAGWICNPDRSTEYAGTYAQDASAYAFPVYETDGAPPVYIFNVGGLTYEDNSGKTYLERDGGYYCITEDKMYWQ